MTAQPRLGSGGSRRRRLAAVAGAATILLAVPAAAWAQPDGADAGRDFGQHLAGCAREMGFDGTHNPGMHRGLAGWPGHDCPAVTQ